MLLQLAVPSIAEAVSTSRAAIIGSQERLVDSVQTQLTTLTEMVTALANGHVLLKIHVSASWDSTSPASLQVVPQPPAVPSVSSSSAPLSGVPSIDAVPTLEFPRPYVIPYAAPITDTSRPMEIPDYTLMDLRTVRDAWQEYKYSIAGKPEVSYLDEEFPTWRKNKPGMATLYCRRKVIWDTVKARMVQGMTEDEAVGDVEAFRGKISLYALQKAIIERRKVRAVQSEKRKRVGEV